MDAALALGPKKDEPDLHFSKCLLCQHGPNKEPLQRLTEQGYPALLYAVENREDDVSFWSCQAFKIKGTAILKESNLSCQM